MDWENNETAQIAIDIVGIMVCVVLAVVYSAAMVAGVIN